MPPPKNKDTLYPHSVLESGAVIAASQLNATPAHGGPATITFCRAVVGAGAPGAHTPCASCLCPCRPSRCPARPLPTPALPCPALPHPILPSQAPPWARRPTWPPAPLCRPALWCGPAPPPTTQRQTPRAVPQHWPRRRSAQVGALLSVLVQSTSADGGAVRLRGCNSSSGESAGPPLAAPSSRTGPDPPPPPSSSCPAHPLHCPCGQRG